MKRFLIALFVLAMLAVAVIPALPAAAAPAPAGGICHPYRGPGHPWAGCDFRTAPPVRIGR